MIDIIMQLSWFFNFAPDWLSLVLIATGLLLAGGGVLTRIENMYLANSFVTMAGIIIASISVFLAYEWQGVFLIILLGKGIEGVSAVRLYQKVVHFFESRPESNDNSTSILVKYSVYYLSLIFVLTLLFGFGIYILISEYSYSGILESIILCYTLFIIVISAFGLAWKLHVVGDSFSNSLIAGLILLVTGSEIYNFNLVVISVSETTYQLPFTDIIVIIAGSISYSVAFWYASWVWMRDLS
ncbi:hypothetical protein [Haloarcula marismortui]|uniref:Uncharacterized protein n=1 Tax=Haloarcula marismortui ATCC 33800 TaxID=662476 RepID=A0A8T8KFR0_9EURY|nr:hypothetical protein [Haloarcula sinaiiensis]QUJ74008.1 hypothetical protein KDQ40_18745 [Haloarcula sinaiiensis ATCC 33800]